MGTTVQKLNEAIVLFEQAKAASNDYLVFISNLNAFVSAARSITLIMREEFSSSTGWKEWCLKKALNEDADLAFFNKLRVDTVHVRPFNTPYKLTTFFKGGLTIPAGTKVIIPLGRADDRGNIVTSDQSPAMFNDKPVSIERSTTRSYHFTERPTEDAIVLCEKYIQKMEALVVECEQNFMVSNK